MRTSRRVYPVFALLAAPTVVALFGPNVPVAVAVTVALLVWWWGVALSNVMAVPSGPELRLETIAASHFVENVRWCLDRLGVDYQEVPDMGVLGAFTIGRTVPRLCIRTGRVTSVIGNSPDILRYLWGRYAAERGGGRPFCGQPSRLSPSSPGWTAMASTCSAGSTITSCLTGPCLSGHGASMIRDCRPGRSMPYRSGSRFSGH
jgi:hypothetical protein